MTITPVQRLIFNLRKAERFLRNVLGQSIKASSQNLLNLKVMGSLLGNAGHRTQSIVLLLCCITIQWTVPLLRTRPLKIQISACRWLLGRDKECRHCMPPRGHPSTCPNSKLKTLCQRAPRKDSPLSAIFQNVPAMERTQSHVGMLGNSAADAVQKTMVIPQSTWYGVRMGLHSFI